MKPTPHKYQLVVWIICGFLILAFSAAPQRTTPDQPAGPSSVGQTQKILASVRLTKDRFESPSSRTDACAIIGAPDEAFQTTKGAYLSNAGSAYIYEQDIAGEWKKRQKLVASDKSANDLFGWTTAISGNYAIVTAPHEEHDVQGRAPARASGAAYIFERNAIGNWIEKQKIVALDRRPTDQFGSSVSISGNYLIVGAHQADKDQHTNNRMSNAGAAYIFERDQTGKWQQIQKIVAEDRKKGDGFGHSVSIVDNLAVVRTRISESEPKSKNEISNSGAAYIFERNSSGVWEQQLKINNPQQTLLCLEKLF